MELEVLLVGFAVVGCRSWVGKGVINKKSDGEGAERCGLVVGGIVEDQRICRVESDRSLLKVVKREGAELFDWVSKMVDTSGAHRGELGWLCGGSEG